MRKWEKLKSEVGMILIRNAECGSWRIRALRLKSVSLEERCALGKELVPSTDHSA
jgi:hypothetical protein